MIHAEQSLEKYGFCISWGKVVSRFYCFAKVLAWKTWQPHCTSCSLICVIGSFNLLFSWYVAYFSLMLWTSFQIGDNTYQNKKKNVSRQVTSSHYHYLSKLMRRSDGWLVFRIVTQCWGISCISMGFHVALSCIMSVFLLILHQNHVFSRVLTGC